MTSARWFPGKAFAVSLEILLNRIFLLATICHRPAQQAKATWIKDLHRAPDPGLPPPLPGIGWPLLSWLQFRSYHLHLTHKTSFSTLLLTCLLAPPIPLPWQQQQAPVKRSLWLAAGLLHTSSSRNSVQLGSKIHLFSYPVTTLLLIHLHSHLGWAITAIL